MSKQLTLGEGFEKYAWAELCELIAPAYPVASNGRPPRELEMMLRVYFLQQWFNLSDPAAEDTLYDSVSIRRFIGLDLDQERAPDETTICRFRHLLERNNLGEARRRFLTNKWRGRASVLSAKERIEVFDGFLDRCRWVEVFYAWRPSLPDEADSHLIELGVAAQADAIVTRNLRDLSRGELKFPTLRVLTPEQCLEVFPCPR